MFEILDGYVSPTIIEERKMNVASMDVFSRLMMERIIFLGTDIDSNVANTVNAQLLWLDSINHNEITLYINSPGGSVYDGLSIYDTIHTIKSPVKTICIGLAASMASILLAAGKKRYALKHSRVMIHQPSSAVKGQASDIVITANEITRVKNELNQILATKTGQPLDKIEKDTDRDYYMTSTEALKYGIIDEII
ncbi:MAG: ATP-dependent Clp protease proteolytic subunit [Clostridia bacterium]|nr:ATP-dependent Clp protease proteolytic subunit [Clostridia bacterium]